MAEKFKKVAEGKVSFKTAAIKEDWKNAQEKAFHKLATKVKVDGFRPGKYPESMLRGKIDPNKIFDEAINQILPLLYGKAIREADVQPYGQPAITVTKLSDEELEVEFTVSVMPSVKLGEYKGLTAKKEAPSVSDKEVEERIQNQLKGAATLEVVDREAKMGDTVVIDFEGYVDGKAFEGGKADNYALELGSHSFVPGFEEALVGVKTGEKKDVRITFPENYVKELASKDALFKCKVHEIKEKEVPAIDDDFVKDVSEFDTLDELKASKREELQKAAEARAEDQMKNSAIEKVFEANDIEVPNVMVEEEINSSLQQFDQQLRAQGMDLNSYVQFMGEDMDKFRESIREDAFKKTKTRMLVAKIVDQEEFELSHDELN